MIGSNELNFQSMHVSEWTLNNIVTLKCRLRVIQGHCRLNGTTQKPWYGFLFAFYSNYGTTLNHVRDKARYWLKIAIFHTPCI